MLHGERGSEESERGSEGSERGLQPARFSPRASERIIFRAAGKITRFKAHGLKPVRTDGGYLAGPALLGEKYPMR